MAKSAQAISAASQAPQKGKGIRAHNCIHWGGCASCPHRCERRANHLLCGNREGIDASRCKDASLANTRYGALQSSPGRNREGEGITPSPDDGSFAVELSRENGRKPIQSRIKCGGMLPRETSLWPTPQSDRPRPLHTPWTCRDFHRFFAKNHPLRPIQSTTSVKETGIQPAM